MLVPSIDLQGGHAVQLVGGKERAIDAGDPRPIAERFARVGELAVIDLDAALGTGSNADVIEELCQRYPCRVGGGIRSVEAAKRWLDAGAKQIILGTAATPEILSQLPRERVLAALDAVDGEVVTHGWTTKTGERIEDRMAALRPHVAGFLITFVEREGRLGGTAMDRVQPLIEAAGDCRITFAGGITTPDEIAELDRLGADSQVGMALYSGRMPLADAFLAPVRSDRPDGLMPTVVCDEHHRALGLVYSSPDSVRAMVEEGRGIYWSRSRQSLWRKGESSGATQQLLRIEADCDRDALKVTVRQAGSGFCHLDTWTCWDDVGGLPTLARTIAERRANAPAGSYTKRLFDDPDLLAAKLREEVGELLEADAPDDVAWETADVLYFALVRAAAAGVDLADVVRHLDARSRKVTRRRGDAKPSPGEAD